MTKFLQPGRDDLAAMVQDKVSDGDSIDTREVATGSQTGNATSTKPDRKLEGACRGGIGHAGGYRIEPCR